MSKSIAVFGSAFNPPSLGHKSVLERLSQYDEVLLLPSYSHAWGKKMLDYDARCDLVEQFIDDLGLENLKLSRLEEEIVEDGEAVTTFAVLQELEARNPDAMLTFVLGPDNFLQFAKFYKSDEIVSRWQVLACPETVPIRSTMIRNQLELGNDVTNLTTSGVANLLKDLTKYRFHV